MRRRSRKQILVVDDEAEICRIVGKVLAEDGYEVSTACGGSEALAKLRLHPVDLMLVDLKMPGVDGLETLKQARHIQADLKAIVLTAYGTAASARSAMRHGGVDFLMKPFDNRLLKKAVKEALGEAL